MNYVRAFFGNYLLMSAAAGWFSAQIIKAFTGMFRERRFNFFVLLFSNGGMPSSHSAAVCSLCTASGIACGLGSPVFAVAAIFAMIVMNDAAGVRYETGEQAKILNRITRELFSGKPEESLDKTLKELVGHTPFQVFMGALLGVLVAVLMAWLMIW